MLLHLTAFFIFDPVKWQCLTYSAARVFYIVRFALSKSAIGALCAVYQAGRSTSPAFFVLSFYATLVARYLWLPIAVGLLRLPSFLLLPTLARGCAGETMWCTLVLACSNGMGYTWLLPGPFDYAARAFLCLLSLLIVRI